jgi:hypothetical protein
MKVLGLDGLEYEWKYYLYDKDEENASGPHLRARQLLRSIYPFSSFSEEIPLVGTFRERLIIDIYIHTQRLAVEVQGAQHYKFNSFFYKSNKDFIRAVNRDKSKIEWCKINDIDLVQLPYNESNEEWEKRIRTR